MIRVTGTLSCRTEAEAAVVQRLLPDHTRLSRAEAGCLSFEVVATEDPMVWRLEESLVDSAAFDAHQTRTRNSVWYGQTRNLQRNFLIEAV